ncbi:hypothetical protein IQ62_27385 [Streptomyces scabiei]|nr:hypothetical protein IQ62_27385 [Streptomyces scabiei]
MVQGLDLPVVTDESGELGRGGLLFDAGHHVCCPFSSGSSIRALSEALPSGTFVGLVRQSVTVGCPARCGR